MLNQNEMFSIKFKVEIKDFVHSNSTSWLSEAERPKKSNDQLNDQATHSKQKNKTIKYYYVLFNLLKKILELEIQIITN